MIRIIYTILLLLVSPFFLYGLFKSKPNKPKIGMRWMEFFGETPKLKKTSSPIWFHSVSVGESIAILPLIEELHRLNPELNILVTTTTPTGAEVIKRIEHIVEHRYMPLDFPFAIKKFLDSVKPKGLVIIETEIWPNLLESLKKSNIPVILVNARMSERSYKGYRKAKLITDRSFKSLRKVLCQTKNDAENFVKLGVPRNNLIITGSLKFDIRAEEAVVKAGNDLRHNFGDRPVWIAASTHPKEEEIILKTHKTLLQSLPRLLLVLVPRHPDRFNEVYDLTQKLNLDTVKRSQKSNILTDCQVYLGDTMGELMTMIQASDVCVMCGSFIGKKVGGHNFLEPAILSKPIITGPSYYNFEEIAKRLESIGLLSILKSEAQLEDEVLRLLRYKLDSKKIKDAKSFFENNQNAKKITLDEIEKSMKF